jgi:hypothetical protein
MRGLTGCETWFGGLTAFLMSGGLAISFWHLLNSCGGGRIPDILQVIGAMAPDASESRVPVVCSAEGFSDKDTSACEKYRSLVQEFLAFSKEFSVKSPHNRQDAEAFQKKNAEMAEKFAEFKKLYANKDGLGANPGEYCLFHNEKGEASKALYNQFLEAQQRMEHAGWKLGI